MQAIVIVAALVAAVVAQGGQYFTNQSPKFRLIIKSDNSTINGSALGACHQGAAIEGLCLTTQRFADPPSAYTTFYHNTTANSEPDDEPGVLGWDLRFNGNLTAPSSMFFSIDPNSNLAMPIFQPGWNRNQHVYFGSCGELYIPRIYDDTRSPPGVFNPAQKVSNWYICLTRWSYLYTALVWKIGAAGEPQNPTCQKVGVSRVFN